MEPTAEADRSIQRVNEVATDTVMTHDFSPSAESSEGCEDEQHVDVVPTGVAASLCAAASLTDNPAEDVHNTTEIATGGMQYANVDVETMASPRRIRAVDGTSREALATGLSSLAGEGPPGLTRPLNITLSSASDATASLHTNTENGSPEKRRERFRTNGPEDGLPPLTTIVRYGTPTSGQ